MSYEITYQTIPAADSASGQEEKLIVAQDTGSGSSNPVPIAIAVDYTAYMKAIADSLTATLTLDADAGVAKGIADQVARIREQLTPTTDLVEAQGGVLADQVSKIRASTRYAERRKKVCRLYISDSNVNNANIGIDRNDEGRTYSASFPESGELSIGSNRQHFQRLWLVKSTSYFPLSEGTTIDQVAMVREGLTGQGTNSVRWVTEYGDRGNYYLYRETQGQVFLAGTITVTDESWTRDEKVTGGTSGTTGYLETYAEKSQRGIRYIDIIDVEKFDENDVDITFEDFQIGESVVGSESGRSANIVDIIRFNHEHETYPSDSRLGDAALYKLYVEEGNILKIDNNVDKESQEEALAVLRSKLNLLEGI
jgi:hypothetical protein